MTRTLISPLVMLAATAVAPTPATANPGPIAEIICAPSVEMRERLTIDFRSQVAWQGIRNPDEIMEIWEDDRGDWTLVISYASGTICIVAMGDPLMSFADLPRG
ncbi:MAG: hypothetical protein AAFQ64_12335 [Pseudomonadota bacterium]